MAANERQLCVFLEAGQTHYAIEAVSVLEVANSEEGSNTLRGHQQLRDLSLTLGGDAEAHAGKVIVLDTSPTSAFRVRSVEGVFDAAADPRLTLPGRMIPLLTPAVRGALLHEGHVVFLLDPDGVPRGLPRQVKRPELMTMPATSPCLVFESAGRPFGIALDRVLQVVPATGFNPAPSTGAFLGAIHHQQHLCPIFSIAECDAVETLIVIVESKGEVMGVSAARADGVKQPRQLGDATILDVERMFS